jgi:hypothetical protein
MQTREYAEILRGRRHVDACVAFSNAGCRFEQVIIFPRRQIMSGIESVNGVGGSGLSATQQAQLDQFNNAQQNEGPDQNNSLWSDSVQEERNLQPAPTPDYKTPATPDYQPAPVNPNVPLGPVDPRNIG